MCARANVLCICAPLHFCIFVPAFPCTYICTEQIRPRKNNKARVADCFTSYAMFKLKCPFDDCDPHSREYMEALAKVEAKAMTMSKASEKRGLAFPTRADLWKPRRTVLPDNERCIEPSIEHCIEHSISSIRSKHSICLAKHSIRTCDPNIQSKPSIQQV